MEKIERQQTNIEMLLELIKENPELEIVPMVDNDVCQGDEFGYWMGSWDKAEIDEAHHCDKRIYFRLDDEEELIRRRIVHILDNEYPNHKFLSVEESEAITKKAEKDVNNLLWEKVIVVYVRLP